jgi:dimethylargininase
MPVFAVTREVSPAITRCELTHLTREPIDVDRARAQHHAYERALEDAGAAIVRAGAAPELPDAVFVEDAALVLDELAIVMRPGARSRRGEVPGVEAALAPFRPIRRIEAPATIDGGDVLAVGRTLYVGRTTRTNAAAIEQLTALVGPHGYAVRGVPVRGCLHLKSAVTSLDERRVLVNRQWIDAEVALDGVEYLDVDPHEPAAANIVRINETLVYPDAFPRTRERIASLGYQIRTVDVSEIAKAEGAVTCCSLIFHARFPERGPDGSDT